MKMKKPDVTIELVDKRGTLSCQRGHKIGDVFDFEADRGRLCPYALHALLPYITVLRYGGELTPSPAHGDCRYSCPDADVGCIYSLKRK